MIASGRFGEWRAPQVVVGTNPAANAEWTQTVPATESWLLLAVTIALVQGATQTPQPVLRVTDGTNLIFESFGCTTAQAVSTTCQYTWAPGLVISGLIGATTGVHAVAPLPANLICQPGYVISSGTTVGLGANTDYGAPNFFVVKGSI